MHKRAHADKRGILALKAMAKGALAQDGTKRYAEVLVPCLDEADTVATCVSKACRALAEGGIAGEVIVADNGSTDGSAALAERAGARVVPVPARGYGAALMGGIAAARGRYVIMGDARYGTLEIPRFVESGRETTSSRGVGCRAAGGACFRERCRFSTAGSGTPCSRGSPGSSSAPRCATSTAACAASGRSFRPASASAARGWSSRPRWCSSRRSSAAASPRCPSPCTPTGARPTHRT